MAAIGHRIAGWRGALTGLGVVVVAVTILALVGPAGASSRGSTALPTHPTAAPARPAAPTRRAAQRPHPHGVRARPGATAPGPAEGPAPSTVSSPPGWTVSVHHLVSDGLDRYYLVARPATATDPAAGSMPVLMVLHGRMMTPAEMISVTHFLAEVGNAIVVYPSGYGESWNAGYCCGQAHAAGIDDVAFLDAVVHQVLAQQPGAEASQVYLAGFSNGGRMAYRMACDAPGVFAGVAAVEAVSVSDCPSTTPVPLLIVAARGDPLLTIGLQSPPKHIEGHAETTVTAESDIWQGLDGCHGPSTDDQIGTLSTQRWDQCAGRGRVELAVYAGGVHAWFEGCTDTPSAENVVWSFFHDRSPVATGYHSACPPPPGGQAGH